MKTSGRSKVMKVLAKSLENATEQHNKLIQASLNAHLILPMSINPLILVHFVMKMSTHASWAKNDYLLGNSCFQCRKDRRQVKSCHTRHAARKN